MDERFLPETRSGSDSFEISAKKTSKRKGSLPYAGASIAFVLIFCGIFLLCFCSI